MAGGFLVDFRDPGVARASAVGLGRLGGNCL